MSFEALYAPLIQPPLPWFSLGLAVFTAWLMGFSRSGLGAGGFVVSPLVVLALGANDGLAVIAVIMIPAGALGGYAGVWMAKRVPQWVVRALVIAVGLLLSWYYFTK